MESAEQVFNDQSCKGELGSARRSWWMDPNGKPEVHMMFMIQFQILNSTRELVDMGRYQLAICCIDRTVAVRGMKTSRHGVLLDETEVRRCWENGVMVDDGGWMEV